MSTDTSTHKVQPGAVQRSNEPHPPVSLKPETTETLWVRLFDGRREQPVFYPGACVRWISRDHSVGRPYKIYVAVLAGQQWHVSGNGKLNALMPMTTDALISTLKRLEIADGDLDVLSGGWAGRDL